MYCKYLWHVYMYGGATGIKEGLESFPFLGMEETM